jgi:hypothetical protein
LAKGTVIIETEFFRKLTSAENAAVAAAANRYGEFLSLAAVLV